VFAKSFGLRYAQQCFATTFNSQIIFGRVAKVKQSKFKGEIRFSFDCEFDDEEGVTSVKGTDVLSFQIPEPPEFSNPPYCLKATPVVPTVNEDIYVYGDAIDRAIEADDDDDDDPAHGSTVEPTPCRTLPSVSIQLTSVTTPVLPNPVPPATTIQFLHFPAPHTFVDVTEDTFATPEGHPCDRFGPDLLDKSPGWCEPLRLFRAMLPKSYLQSIVLSETSAHLVVTGKPPMQQEELWKYLGYRVAMTLFKAYHLNDYWSEVGSFLRPALNFGQYGMSRDRFKDITAAIKFTRGQNLRDPLHAIRDLITAFNANMCNAFQPGWVVCVDESMVHWSNRITLPNWVYVPRKPTPMGQEWHDIACGMSRIIFVLEPVETGFVRRHETVSKMAGVVLRLTEDSGLWDTPRLLVGDSAFPSIHLMDQLLAKKIHSIFAFKKHGRGWTKGIPGEFMLEATQDLPLGQSVCLRSDQTKKPKFFVAGLRDLNTCLIMCTGSSMSKEHDLESTTRFTRDASSRIITVNYKRPECFALYYHFRHAVDDSNNLRQNSDAIEVAWQTQDWSHRTFAFILGLCETNAFNAYRQFATNSEPMDHMTFRRILCEELLSEPQPAAAPVIKHYHVRIKFKKGQKWKNGRFVPYPKNRFVRGQIQKSCPDCMPYKKVSYHCQCDGSRGMCDRHWERHILSLPR